MLGGVLRLHHYTEKNLEFPSFHCRFRRKVLSESVFENLRDSQFFMIKQIVTSKHGF